ncbi:DUF2378 family protein [Archangium lansingense]|uniref:DUF2378 family protein n=1 Tax=Archangium lansingense TaxID=2995310 RepID=UPI003B7D440C
MSVPHRAIRREPVVFGHALELVLADAEALGSRASEALAGLGLSLNEPLRAAYPGALWAGAIHILSEALYPHLSTPKAEFALGRRFMERALQSRLGAAMMAHAKVIGPQRTLQRLTHNLRAFNNFLGASARELPGQAGWELVMRPLPEFFLAPGVYGEPPQFTRGMLTTAFHTAGLSRVRMDVVHHEASLGMSIFHLAF